MRQPAYQRLLVIALSVAIVFSGSLTVLSQDAAAAPADTAQAQQAAGVPAIAVDGNTATYANALPSTTLSYQAGYDATKESLVLADANAPRSFAFAIQLSPGLTPQALHDAMIAIADAQGNVPFSLEAPYLV